MFRYIYNKLIRPIILIRSSPHSIALGVALGLFVSLTPTVGFQMALVVVAGTLIRANRIVAVILCWISNPVTFLPMYYGYYYLGAKILRLDLWTFGSFSRKLQEFSAAVSDLGYLETVRMFGSDILAPLWLGSILIALAVALPSYPLVLYLLKRRRNLRFARMMKRRAAIQAERDARGGGGPSSTGEPAVCAPTRRKGSGGAGGERPPAAGRAVGGKAKIFFLLLAAGLFCVSCPGRSPPGAVSNGEASLSPREAAFALFRADLGGKCHLFVEFPGFEEGMRRYAFLRIYNFSDTFREMPGIEESFLLEGPGGKCPLRPVDSGPGGDPSGVSVLLALTRPRPGIPPHRWTRVVMEFTGFPFPLPGGKVFFLPPGRTSGGGGGKEGNRGRLSVPGESEGGKRGIRPMELLKVSRDEWDDFKGHPTLKGLETLLGRMIRSGD